MSQGTSGLFYAKHLVAKDRPEGPAFCKPINIRVYSAPPPVRMRVVTYEMVYWDGQTQPDVSASWSELKRYQSPSGLRNFSFTVGTVPASLETLLTEIRRHFYAVVQSGKSCRTRDQGIDRLLSMNSAQQHVVSTGPDRTMYRVFDVHHVITVRVDTDKNHYVASEKLRYHAELKSETEHHLTDDQFISAPLEYWDNRDLTKRALAHLQCDETVTLIKSTKKSSMV